MGDGGAEKGAASKRVGEVGETGGDRGDSVCWHVEASRCSLLSVTDIDRRTFSRRIDWLFTN